MLSFIVTVRRFLKALYHAGREEEFRALVFITVVLLFSGSIFYSYHEHWSYLDVFYFCVMTMTTIGYGDLTPTTDLSKIFTIVYAFISIGVFVSLAAKLATGLMYHNRKHRHKHDDINPII